MLLALSGHPSPLFDTPNRKDLNSSSNVVKKDFPLLSSSEAAQLQSLGRLALLHRRIREHAEGVRSQHGSTICRAVASSLVDTHLSRFQAKILEVERQILMKDPKTVGAYNIVPLSLVVGEFDEWTRRMEWYWQLACFIRLPKQDAPSRTDPRRSGREATGAALIDFLRSEAQTGYADIETAAVELSKVAETAWLRQVSVWLLHGNLPGTGASDFFVAMKAPIEPEGRPTYSVQKDLLPKSVSSATAESMLFVGKSLHQVRQHRETLSRPSLSQTSKDFTLMSTHLRMLSSLSLPLIPSAFARTISSIRLSLSQNLLQHLLPIESIVQVLATLRQYFLLERGEFALALIAEAESRLAARRDGVGKLLQGPPNGDLRGMVMKEGEVSETLSRTWKGLYSSSPDDEEDPVQEFAEENVRLEISGAQNSRPSTSDSVTVAGPEISNVQFNDLLLPVPISLTLDIHSPLDLFISPKDIGQYSTINSYLLALRRAHVRLSDLWRLSSSRRDISATARSNPVARQRTRQRETAMRKVWASCSSAVFLLSETAAYLEGEVITSSWDHFYAWATKGSSTDRNPPESLHAAGVETDTPEAETYPHDPETLATAHRLFLSHLLHALLLTDIPFTSELRAFLTDVDQLIALFVRLQRIQHSLDLEEDEGVVDAFGNFKDEEKEVALLLDRARKRVDMGMKGVVGRLRGVDRERVGGGSGRGSGFGEAGGEGEGGRESEGGFTPWRGGGVERLLMKLDFGRLTVEEEGDVLV